MPKNRLFPEILEKGLSVRDGKGNLPYEDAVLDFSNADAVRWYREKIAGLLRLGVGAIKVDFGEAAPLTGLYASGRSGFYEHNLYPLRYNRTSWPRSRARSPATDIIWARSAWAGSQRYPVHWGGDAGKMDVGMAATLRGGLSLGLSGFTFWSHDIGGFLGDKAEEVYRRWVPFGMLSSHSRSHGTAAQGAVGVQPRVPRRLPPGGGAEYRLMPYIYAQARDASERGLPMVRALFVEYPDDPGLLAGGGRVPARLRHPGGAAARGGHDRARGLPAARASGSTTRRGRSYAGGWQQIAAGALPVVALVREGAVIPHTSWRNRRRRWTGPRWTWSSSAAMPHRSAGPRHPARRQRAAPVGAGAARAWLRAGERSPRRTRALGDAGAHRRASLRLRGSTCEPRHRGLAV